MVNKLKILEICPFSSGIDGVWSRVKQESLEFIKQGYEVTVFSSDVVKGKDEKAKSEEIVQGIKIKRFPSKSSLFSENVKKFNFNKKLEQLNPDIIITHTLHPHSFKALRKARKLKIPCYLVPHAPFNVKRKFPLNLLTWAYNLINVKSKIKKFTKIINITEWELPYLEKLGVEKNKIIYIPNGIPDEFFTQSFTRTKKDVLFLGRIAPVKNLETLIEAAKQLPEINFTIVGSAEQSYLDNLNEIIKKHNLTNIEIQAPIYNLTKKIKLIDEYKIFVLPSNREAMPQVLIEAMSRGKIILASNTDGAKEIINNEKNGFLFEIGNSTQLASLIKQNIKGNKTISKQAIQDSKKYAWSKLVKSYLELFNKFF